MTISFRALLAEDIDEVFELGNESSEVSTGIGGDAFYSKEILSNWIRDPNGVAYVAKVENILAGFILAEMHTASLDAYVDRIVVKQEYKMKGIGKTLLNKVFSDMKEKGAINVWALTEPNNVSVQNMFAKLGFQTGKTFLYLQGRLASS